MKFHPLSEIFPLLEGQAFEELVADIRENGVREPVWVYHGEILDGRNRFRAAEAASREAPTREYTGDDPLKFVLSLNLHRRHLDESQRSMVAAKIANLGEGRPSSETMTGGAVSQDTAAEAMNVSRRSVSRAKKVIERAAPEVVKAVERGELEVKVAAEIADAPREEQIEAVQHGKEGVKQLRKKIKATAAPAAPRESKAEFQARERRTIMDRLVDIARAIEIKTITPKHAAEISPWLFKRDGNLVPFINKCVKLAAAHYQRMQREARARRKKWQQRKARERKLIAKRAAANAKKLRKSKPAKAASSKNTSKRIRTARSTNAVRRPARRSGDTKQRRSAKPATSRVGRRLSHHSTVSA